MEHETLQSKCVSLELDLKIAKSALVAISKMPGCGAGKARREAQQTLNMLSEAGKLSSALAMKWNLDFLRHLSEIKLQDMVDSTGQSCSFSNHVMTRYIKPKVQ
jgi:hypothetical protein